PVAVFEAGVLGEGASTRNGGMVGPSFHKLGLAGMKNKFGKTRADAIIKESVGFVSFLETFLETEKIEADFARTGRFLGALKPADFDSMAKELDILKRSINVEGHMVEKKDQAEETGSTLFHGGMVFKRDGGLHPAKYHEGLVQRVQDAGALIFAKTPVIEIENLSGEYRVKTPGGELKVTNVAVCTNGYTKSVTQDLRKRVLPLRSAMIATEQLEPELLSKLMPKKRMYGDRRRLVAYYRPSPDGKRILFGGRATGLKEKPTANTALLRASMLEIFPELSKQQISHSWSGLVAYSFDHVPHLGQFGGGRDDGLYYAMGYCGSGVARSTYFGTKLGHKILGSDEGNTAFDDLKFETRPFYTGNPWFMSGILAWHRAADKLGL
ncbi:MAG: FAD-binding oxidoreductase, partial [Sneathiella sp.]|nr:FAD-binding oxidoreductase [Sneathiella sp.]